MPRFLPIRNPLVFPAGVAAGFNPNHIAARNTRFSGVSLPGGGAVNLLTGLPGTPVAGPASVIFGGIGVALNAGGAGEITFTGALPLTAETPVTMACVCQFITSANGQMLRTTSWRFEANGPNLRLTSNGITAIDSLIALAIDTPYFIAASAGASASAFVVKNLATGQVQFKTTTGSTTPTTSDGTMHYTVAGVGTNIRLAAGMMSEDFAGIQTLLKWANAPWEFWYPQNDYQFVGVAAGGASTGVLSSTGAGAATWTGAANDAAVVSAAGIGAASWVSSAIDAAVLASVGTGAAAWVGNSVAGGGALVASGVGAANWISGALSAAILNASGQGAFNAASPAPITAIASMSGSGLARFVGSQASGATGFDYPPGYGRYAEHSRNPKHWINEGFVDEPDW